MIHKAIIILLGILGFNGISSSQVQIQSLVTKDDPTVFEMVIDYPVYSDNRARILNDSLRQYLSSRKQSFLSTAFFDTSVPFQAYFTAQVLSSYDTGSFVSYCFEINECPNGYCHGTTEFITFNFDLSSQKFLSPRDFILSTDSQIGRLMSKNYDHPESECYEEDTRMLTNWGDIDRLKVNVENDKIVINFSDYELNAYVCGSHRIKIPRQEISLRIPN